MKTILLSLLLSFSSFVCATKAQEAAVDKIFSDWNHVDEPGAAMGIFREGKIIYSRGYGLANLEYDIPIDENSVFRIGSTSKQFTAACIVLLAEQGKLKLTDSLHSFFPAFPDYAKDITVRQLLHHTSGIRDYLTLSFLKGLGNEDYYEDKDVMQWLINQKELNFKPGEQDMYSNSGYWLLSQIVKQVSGMDMAEYAEKNIFKPLNMHQTHFHNNHKSIVKKRASGYSPKNGEANEFEINMTKLNMIGDGGIFTTINDIKKWDDAYYDSQILSKQFWQEMTSEGELNNGKKIGYASGLVIEKYKGLDAISHGGAFVGYRAELLRFPEQKFTVAVFANRSDARPTSMAFQVADVFLKEVFKEELKDELQASTNEELNTQVKPALFEHLTGDYQIEPGIILTISIKDEKLHAFQSWNEKEYDFEPINNAINSYKIVDDKNFIFAFNEFINDQAQVINLDQNGSQSEWKRIERVDFSDVVQTDFVNDYYSEELDVIFRIQMHEGALTLKVGNNDPILLKVSAINQLMFNGFILDFQRQDGAIVGFKMASPGVKNLSFVKQ